MNHERRARTAAAHARARSQWNGALLNHGQTTVSNHSPPNQTGEPPDWRSVPSLAKCSALGAFLARKATMSLLPGNQELTILGL